MEDRERVRDLDAWLAPVLAALGRKTRRHWVPLYLRGLLGLGERKGLQPMAARLGLSGHDQLQHVIASPTWDDGPLWSALARDADRLVGGPDACVVIDDTALPKNGTRSVGVARQYCGSLGDPSINSGGQRPVAGLAHPGAGRGAGTGRFASVPAQRVGE